MKINIGHTEYDLTKVSEAALGEEYAKHKDDCDDEMVAGYCHPLLAEIKIGKELPFQAKKQVFWHEAVHAILDEMGMAKLSEDEGFVDALSKQIYGVLKNNNVDKIYKFLEGGSSGHI